MARLSLPTIIERNAKATVAPNSVGVFVGGTSGIGEYTAYAFAKYVANPTIYIVGRNAEAGARVVSKLKEINGKTNARFLQHDITLIKEADKVAAEISKNETKVNFLFLTAGYSTLEGRKETSEGIEKKMAVNYYGRWRVFDRLSELIQKAGEQDQNARVITVLEAGHEGAPDINDLDLKNTYSFMKYHTHVVEFNSLAVARGARLYPNITFIHAGPGIVKTGIARGLPWYLRGPSNFVLSFIATAPENAGERFYYLGAAGKEYSQGSFLLKGNFDSVKEAAENKGVLTDNLQDIVWKHSQDLWDAAIKK